VLEIGDHVQNAKVPEWGTGIIRKLSSAKATVFFPSLDEEKNLLTEFLRVVQVTSSNIEKAHANLRSSIPQNLKLIEWSFELGAKVWNGWILKFERIDSEECLAFIEENWRKFSQVNTRCFRGLVTKNEQVFAAVCVVPDMPQMAVAEYAEIAKPLSIGKKRLILAKLGEVFSTFPFEIVSAFDDQVSAKFTAPLTDKILAKRLRQLLPRCSDDQGENRLQSSDLIADNGFCLHWWD
jgi:hypothetical protein